MGNLFYRDKNQENDVGVNSPLPVRQFPDKTTLNFSVASITDGTSTVSSFDLAHSVVFTFEPRILALLTTFNGPAGNLIGGIFIRKEKKNGTSPSVWRMLMSFTGSSSPSMAVPAGANANRNFQQLTDIILHETIASDEQYRIGVGYRANGSNINALVADLQIRGY